MQKDFFKKKFKQRVVRPKKGKGSFKEKKNNLIFTFFSQFLKGGVKCSSTSELSQYKQCLQKLKFFHH